MAKYAPIGEIPLAHRAKKLAAYALGAAALVVSSGLLVQQHNQQPAAVASAPPLRSAVTLTKQEDGAANFTGAADQIVGLAGLPESYTSRLFSGYLPIGNGGEAFYFFAESQSETPESDPVLLWLNGGPGASSLAGCFSENGPLIVNDDGETLRDNDFAWNKNANFICIESPVGVGFSYNVSGLYESDDLKQANELYAALQSFYGKFPWLRANDFIISGESYGGIYVPTTAKRIVEGNLEEGAAPINLKKFVVGNGVNEFGGLSAVLYAYYHGLISTEDYRSVRGSCPDLQEFKPSVNVLSADTNFTSPCAIASVNVMTKLFQYHINSYNIYGSCYGTTEDGLKALVKEILTPDQGLPHPLGSPMTPCLDSRNLDKYFNQPSVRAVMHTKPEIDRWYGSALPKDGIEMIAKFIGLNDSAIEQYQNHTLLDYKSTLGSVVTPMWKFLLAHNISGVIYHGDADMVCDFIGGLWAVESMELPRQQDRSIWTVEDAEGADQTAGFLEDFGALKYVTVKGAGHLVPQVKPVEAKKMLDLFVLN